MLCLHYAALIQNKDCHSKKVFSGPDGAAIIKVVDEDGKLGDMCLYCDGGPRSRRKKSKNVKYSD